MFLFSRALNEQLSGEYVNYFSFATSRVLLWVFLLKKDYSCPMKCVFNISSHNYLCIRAHIKGIEILRVIRHPINSAFEVLCIVREAVIQPANKLTIFMHNLHHTLPHDFSSWLVNFMLHMYVVSHVYVMGPSISGYIWWICALFQLFILHVLCTSKSDINPTLSALLHQQY